MRGWFQRHAAGLVVLLLAVVVVAPGADIQLWDGLPLDSLPEMLAAVVLVPLVFSRALRAQLAGFGARLTPHPVRSISIVLVGILVVKLALLAGGFEAGFRGCYGSPAAPAKGCERSYTNLFDRHEGATRIDPEIAFGGKTDGPPPSLSRSDWNLPFANDLRFDLPARPSNAVPRERLPLAVQWTGKINTDRGADVVVSYVGQGEIRIGGVRRTLPQSYLGTQEVRIPSQGGVRPFTLTYSYRPLISIGPYAAVKVSVGRGPLPGGGGQPLHAAPPAAAWRVLAFLDDTALALLLVLIAIGQARALGSRDGAFLLTVAAGGWLVLVDYSPWREALFIAGLGVALVLFRPDRPLIVSWYALVVLCSLHTLVSASSLGEVTYTTSGSESLNHESYARSILGGSLRGGESDFHVQPGWRYILFVERAVFGDGDVFRSAFTFVSVSLPMVAVGLWAVARRPGFRLAVATAALVGGALLVLNSPDVRSLLLAGVGDSVTWALIPLIVAIPFFVPDQRWPWVVGPAAAALTVAITPNDLIAALLLIVAIGYAAPPAQRRWFVAGAGLAVLVALLPTLHDTIYGDRFLHLSLTSGASPSALELKPEDLVSVLWDSHARSVLWNHIQQILYVSGPAGAYSTTLSLLLPAMLLSWLTALAYVIRRRRSAPRGRVMAMAVPAAYLAPYLLYQVDAYFPRRIVAGYLAMAAVTIGLIVTAESLERIAAPASAQRRRPWAGLAMATRRLGSRSG